MSEGSTGRGADPGTASEEMRRPGGEAGSGGKAAARRVLVVEDDRLVHEIIRGVLPHHGHAVATAGDGPSALAAARDVPPDAVVLDLQIPHLHGREVLSELKERF